MCFGEEFTFQYYNSNISFVNLIKYFKMSINSELMQNFNHKLIKLNEKLKSELSFINKMMIVFEKYRNILHNHIRMKMKDK